MAPEVPAVWAYSEKRPIIRSLDATNTMQDAESQHLSLQFLTALHFSPFQCHHPLLCVFLRAGTHAEATERSTGWPVVSFICVFVEGPVTGLEMANQAGLASQQAPGGTGQSPPPQCQDYKQALV